MDNFESTLLRLKEQLSVRTDKEVAEKLGLTVKAFTARKMRNAFPIDKLMALKASMPNLNVEYILTGSAAALIAGSLREARAEIDAFYGELNKGAEPKGYSVAEPAAGYGDRVSNLQRSFALLDEDGKQAVETMIKALLKKEDN